MSSGKMVLVMHNSKTKGLAKLLMLTLADAMNDKSEGVWLAVSTMVARSGISETTVHQLLRDLQSGHLELEISPKAGMNGTNLYRLGSHYRLGGAAGAPYPESLLSTDSESSTREYKGLGAPHAPDPPHDRHSSVPHPNRANGYAQWDTSE